MKPRIAATRPLRSLALQKITGTALAPPSRPASRNCPQGHLLRRSPEVAYLRSLLSAGAMDDVPAHVNRGEGASWRWRGFDPANSGQQPARLQRKPSPGRGLGYSDTGAEYSAQVGAAVWHQHSHPPAGRGRGARCAAPVWLGAASPTTAWSAKARKQWAFLPAAWTTRAYSESPSVPPITRRACSVPAPPAATGSTGFVGDAAGVLGSSVRGTGVHGFTRSGTGVRGESVGAQLDRPGPGVHGMSDVAAGVRGVSGSANGSEGTSFGSGSGVVGVNFSPDAGAGVTGRSVLGNGVEGFTFADIRAKQRRGRCARPKPERLRRAVCGECPRHRATEQGRRRIHRRPSARSGKQIPLSFVRRIPGDAQRLTAAR